MEKAFDRVSIQFLLSSMESLGFGKDFIGYVNLMYGVNAPPKRRIYANGYYSKWFPIKSGVAQGCPLSPLLFLIVGPALKISFDLETQLKGIEDPEAAPALGRSRFYRGGTGRAAGAQRGAVAALVRPMGRTDGPGRPVAVRAAPRAVERHRRRSHWAGVSARVP